MLGRGPGHAATAVVAATRSVYGCPLAPAGLCQHGRVQDKATLRRRIRAARRDRPAPERAAAGRQLARVILAEPVTARAHAVLAYGALPTEPDLQPVIDTLMRRGVRVGLPRVDENGLTFAEHTGNWRDGVPVAGGLQIPEPTGTAMDPRTCDLILIPALAVDRAGVRLGQGGGHYDRTGLTRLQPRPPVVAVVFDDEFVPDPLPAEAHDTRVDAVVTPTAWTWLPGGLGSGHA